MATFKTVHTLYGLRRLAAAEVSGVPINLPTMAVGDGNGNPVEPSDAQSQLVRERFRAPVNRVYQEADKPTHFIVELVIPLAVGGFTLREFGVFDDTGALFVCGNLPAMYKPTADDGAFTDTIVRVEFAAQNASVITLQIDPNIAVASQSWVVNNVTSALLIPGGTTGQLLRKVSNADGDTEWHDPDAINVTVDTIEETQELAAGQTVVDLAVTTTRGLALYIEGERLRRDEWTPDPAVVTRLTLGTAYPAGTKLIAAQNEPTGNAPAPLERSKNLSDLDHAATARTNLGVYSKQEADRICPIGTPLLAPTMALPVGYVVRNGAALSRAAYWQLFNVIGTAYGAGDGFNTFNVPDDRGGYDGNADIGRGLDAAMVMGAWLGSQIGYHGHPVTIADNGVHEHPVTIDPNGVHEHPVTIDPNGVHEHPVTIDPNGEHIHGGGGLVGPGRQGLSTLEEGHGGLDYPVNPVQPAGNHIHSGRANAAGQHAHTGRANGAGQHAHSGRANSAGTHRHDGTVGATGAAHTRPNGRAYMPIMRAY